MVKSLSTYLKRKSHPLDMEEKHEMDQLDFPSYATEEMKSLLTLYSTLEFVLVSMMRFRHISTFENVQKEIERSIRRNFTKKHLSKILFIFPESIEIVKVSLKDSTTNRFVLKPCIRRRSHLLNSKIKSAENSIASSSSTNHHMKSSTRISLFKKKLIEWLENQLIEMEHSNINTPLENLQIPESPLLNENIEGTVKKCIQSDHNKENQPKEMETSKNQNSLEKASEHGNIQESKSKPVPSSLEGLPSWLIEKVRLKEKHKRRRLENAEIHGDSILLSTIMPLFRQLISYVQFQRKFAFSTNELCEKLRPKQRQVNIDKQVSLLQEIAPTWISTFYDDKSQLYIRLIKSQSYDKLSKDIEDVVKTRLRLIQE